MSRDHRHRGISDAQANAEALARRGLPFAGESQASAERAWDWRKRQPRNLREAVRMVRAAYADEVPGKLHEGYDDIGEGGTPKMTARAEGYLFGRPDSTDSRDPDQLVSYFHSPFRATLDRFARGNEADRFIAAVVGHVTIGSQGPKEALEAEGIPRKAHGLMAFNLFTAFLAQVSDLRVDERPSTAEAAAA